MPHSPCPTFNVFLTIFLPRWTNPPHSFLFAQASALASDPWRCLPPTFHIPSTINRQPVTAQPITHSILTRSDLVFFWERTPVAEESHSFSFRFRVRIS